MKVPFYPPRGQGLLEYALILSLVALLVILILVVFGSGTEGLYDQIQQQIVNTL